VLLTSVYAAVRADTSTNIAMRPGNSLTVHKTAQHT